MKAKTNEIRFPSSKLACKHYSECKCERIEVRRKDELVEFIFPLGTPFEVRCLKTK